VKTRVWQGGQMTLGSPVADYVHAWIDPHEAPLEEGLAA
jgi:hypothetical protein